MKKNLIISIYGIILIGVISSGVIYKITKKSAPINETILVNKPKIHSTQNLNKDKIQPNTVIFYMGPNVKNHAVAVMNTVKKWMTEDQFNYVDFNPKETQLNKKQLKEMNESGSLALYSFIYANGPEATDHNITAKELNKTAIRIKEQTEL